MVDATRFFFWGGGCMVASRGGYRMARGRHYDKLSLSDAARLSFSDLCILLFLFLSLCRLCVCVFLCSHWSLVDVPLIFFCPADHVPDWQPRALLGMVEARSVNVKKKTKQQQYAPVRLEAQGQKQQFSAGRAIFRSSRTVAGQCQIRSGVHPFGCKSLQPSLERSKCQTRYI